MAHRSDWRMKLFAIFGTAIVTWIVKAILDKAVTNTDIRDWGIVALCCTMVIATAVILMWRTGSKPVSENETADQALRRLYHEGQNLENTWAMGHPVSPEAWIDDLERWSKDVYAVLKTGQSPAIAAAFKAVDVSSDPEFKEMEPDEAKLHARLRFVHKTMNEW